MSPKKIPNNNTLQKNVKEKKIEKNVKNSVKVLSNSNYRVCPYCSLGSL